MSPSSPYGDNCIIFGGPTSINLVSSSYHVSFRPIQNFMSHFSFRALHNLMDVPEFRFGDHRRYDIMWGKGGALYSQIKFTGVFHFCAVTVAMATISSAHARARPQTKQLTFRLSSSSSSSSLGFSETLAFPLASLSSGSGSISHSYDEHKKLAVSATRSSIDQQIPDNGSPRSK